MATTLYYLAFLASYLIFLWVSYKFLNPAVKSEHSEFWQNELLIIVPTVMLFLCLFSAARFFNGYLLLIIVAVSHIGYGMFALFAAFSGKTNIPYASIGGWIGANWGVRNKIYSILSILVGLVLLIVYPVLIGIYVFREPIEVVRALTFRETTVFLVLLSLSQFPVVMACLSSSYIDEGTRSRFLITQIGNVFFWAVFLSMNFWPFNWDQSGINFFGDWHHLRSNYWISIPLLIFLAIFIVLPYSVGVLAASRRREEFSKEERTMLSTMVEILASPFQNIQSELLTFRQTVAAQLESFVQQHNGIRIGLIYDQFNDEEQIVHEERDLFNYFKKARHYDVRFAHVDFMVKLIAKIDSVSSDLSASNLMPHSEYFKWRIKMLGDSRMNDRETKPWALIAVVTFFSILFSHFVNSIGEFIISFVKNILT